MARQGRPAAVGRVLLRFVSWETPAQDANFEDACTGRFWEGRFKSQALLDEKALAACMAYVDLNPIRARMAEAPETSDFTSAKRHIETAMNESESSKPSQPTQLFTFVGYSRQNMLSGLPFRLQDYLGLIGGTGRQIRNDKRGQIDQTAPPILERLNIDPEQWVYHTQHFESQFKGLVGTVLSIKSKYQQFGYRRSPPLGSARLLA